MLLGRHPSAFGAFGAVLGLALALAAAKPATPGTSETPAACIGPVSIGLLLGESLGSFIWCLD